MYQNKFVQSWSWLSASWKFVIITCLVLGIFFRFVNPDGKVYQYDETFTSLRISGYTETEAVQALTDAQLVTVADLQKYQMPNSEHSVVDTVKGLAVEEPQLTPLYFGLMQFWTSLFGGSVASVRTLTAIFSVLAFPLLWWFCLELFGSPTAGWVAIVLLAVSPFQILYAQEARPQSLWLVTTLISSICLLRAMRLQTPRSWIFYGLSSIAALYSFLFAGLVVIAHGIYVLIVERFRPTKTVLMAGLAIGVSVLAFLPWLLAILSNMEQVNVVTNWAIRDRMTVSTMVKVWLHHASVSLLDWGTFTFAKPIRLVLSLLGWGVRLLLVYAFYVLCRKTPPRIWAFVVTLTVIPFVCLLLPDLISGGTRTTAMRYFVPMYLGFNLAITYLLSRKLEIAPPASVLQQRLWRGVTIALVSCGVLSCVLIAQSDRWWSKMISNNNPAAAQLINQSERPLVISDASSGDLFSLSYYLDPKVKLLIRPQCYTCHINRDLADVPFTPEIPTGYSDVFYYQPRPTEPWLDRLKQNKPFANRMKTVSEGFDNWLWKVK
jgi:uncharacterized membrane protein